MTDSVRFNQATLSIINGLTSFTERLNNAGISGIVGNSSRETLSALHRRHN